MSTLQNLAKVSLDAIRNFSAYKLIDKIFDCWLEAIAPDLRRKSHKLETDQKPRSSGSADNPLAP